MRGMQTKNMAAMESLLAYGTSESENSGDSDGDFAVANPENTLHLKPLKTNTSNTIISNDLTVVAAPEVATKVESISDSDILLLAIRIFFFFTSKNEFHGLRPIEYGPRRKRTMLNAAHILLQNPRTDVRGESIFICFKRSTCNCFHTFHNEIMYNVYIII